MQDEKAMDRYCISNTKIHSGSDTNARLNCKQFLKKSSSAAPSVFFQKTLHCLNPNVNCLRNIVSILNDNYYDKSCKS